MVTWLGRREYVAGGERRRGEPGEIGSAVSSNGARLPAAVWAWLKAVQFHWTELLLGWATSTLVLALPSRAEGIEDDDLCRSFAAHTVSAADVRRELDAEEIRP
jgi:hypothetical protein